MNKIVYVPAFFKALGKYKTVAIPTGETKKGMFGGEKEVTIKEKQWVETGEFSDCHIDDKRLAEDLAIRTKELNDEGYEIISVTPVTSADYHYSHNTSYSNQRGWGWGYGYGYGYSYTSSLIITAKKIVL